MPSAGLHLAALSSRLVTARSRLLGVADHDPRVGRDVEGDALGAPAYAGHGPLDDVGEVDLGDDVGHRLVAGELDEVADERAQLLDLAADVVEQLEPRLAAAAPSCPRPGGAGRGWCAAR